MAGVDVDLTKDRTTAAPITWFVGMIQRTLATIASQLKPILQHPVRWNKALSHWKSFNRMISDRVYHPNLQEPGDNDIYHTSSPVRRKPLTDVKRRHGNRNATRHDGYQSANVSLDKEIQAILLPHQQQHQEPSIANDLRCPEQVRDRGPGV